MNSWRILPFGITTRSPLLVGLATVVLASVFPWAMAFRSLDLAWFDWQLQLGAASRTRLPREDVVVVALDDASLESFGVPIAMLHRQMGQFLEAMAAAKPRAIGIDVVLPERSYDRIAPGLDAALARGIVTARKVVPVFFGVGAREDGTPQPLYPPFAHLAGEENLGSIYVIRDADGRVRRFDERIGVAGQSVPTLVGRLAGIFEVPVASGLLPLDRGTAFSYTPLKDVLAWQADKDVAKLQAGFAGKVVLLGSLLANTDQHVVAVNPATTGGMHTTHGVFILAAQLRSLLNGAIVREFPTVLTALVSALFAFTWLLRPRTRSWALVIVAIAGLAFASNALLSVGWLLPFASWAIAMSLGLAGRTALAGWASFVERLRLRRAFRGLVSPPVLREIVAGRLDSRLDGERREICVLFSDIRGFTTLSESLAPEAVRDLLNRYFQRMALAVHRHGGTVDKFIGDGMMAVFGAPQERTDPVGDAFAAAQDMLRELLDFNREQADLNGPQVAIGIGLHYGPAFVGFVGSRDRHEYSAIGDTVNIASRLEGTTKDAGYPVVMSTAVREKLPEGTACVDLGNMTLKGRAPIHAFGWKPREDT